MNDTSEYPRGWDTHRIREMLRAVADRVPGAKAEMCRNASADLAFLLAEVERLTPFEHVNVSFRANLDNARQALRDAEARAKKAERERERLREQLTEHQEAVLELLPLVARRDDESFIEAVTRVVAERDAARAMVEAMRDVDRRYGDAGGDMSGHEAWCEVREILFAHAAKASKGGGDVV